MALLLLLATATALATGNKRSVGLYWDVDSSGDVATPAGVDRGNRTSCTDAKYCRGNNGAAVNVYGNKGDMPHFSSSGEAVNGGIPQRGNLSLHLALFRRDFAALVPDAAYVGYCLLDYEFFRADWNSTLDTMRAASVSAAGGNEAEAKAQYEAAAKVFMLGTLEAARALRPGCRLGYYGYPRNNLPTAAGDSPAFKKYCAEHPFDCSFDGYGNTTAGDAQRVINDGLEWLWQASDALFPSVYLGKLPSQQNSSTANESMTYIRQTVGEATRLAEHAVVTRGRTVDAGARPAAKRAAAGKPEVVAVTWYFYDNYPRTPTWSTLTAADLRIELETPLAAGADGVLLWGAVDNSTMTPAALQEYATSTLAPVVSGICAQYTCAALEY